MQRIFVKVLVFGLGIALINTLILSLVLSSLFTRYFYRSYSSLLLEALKEGKEFAEKYEHEEIKRPAFERALVLIDRLEGVHFCFLDAQRRILFTTAPQLDIGPTQGMLAKLNKELSSQEFCSTFFTDPRDPSLDIMVGATRVNDKILLAFFPVADIREPVRESVMLVWLAAAGAFLISIVPAYLISRHFTRPLEEMGQLALRMGKGDFSVRFHTARQDEIGQLARTLDAMAAQLEAIDRERQEFLAYVSHELRTPLTSIRGFVQGMLDGTIPPEKQQSYLARVFSETERLRRLVDDLLMLVRLRSGRFTFNWQNTDLRRVLTTVEEVMSPLALEKGVQLEFRTREELPVYADEGRLVQVFMNLVDNAIKFSPPGGRVLVEAEKSDGLLRVQVTDEGPGIPPEELPRIFDSFYSGAARSRSELGTGLGLAISKLIVEKHGGHISVQNRPEGGCTFTVLLPAGGRGVNHSGTGAISDR
ncbi:sensor histidine kinase [Ammonifex thiophilus]|uniref:histidine kinase n=1 Tax=Ammonifex thiophilus TaxID=444093 RepID=A0A3D8P347_9THEO|nr:HAMP domain-containing sensor histidine kinase [Ammonifex thiophilus]RDV80727.1 sensor histidine kinase [Ammonifex thiophilus]